MSNNAMVYALETRYNGYCFRSRLEARWAVFFDSLGIKYEYEPEGFKLPSGCYLPDFKLYLPNATWFAEVKPLGGFTKRASALTCELAEFAECNVACLEGPPSYTSGINVCFKEGEDNPYFFCECLCCGRVGLEFDGESSRIDCCSLNRNMHGSTRVRRCTRKISQAIMAAKSARFGT